MSQFATVQQIRKLGFKGFLSVSALRVSTCREVPDAPGVYLIVRSHNRRPRFRADGTGGRFKGRNPNTPVSVLKQKWVENTAALYFGKAGSKKGLRQRLKAYLSFGQGKPIAHWGGRFIWQTRGSAEFLVCWLEVRQGSPRDIEKRFIREFEAVHKKLPFANLCH